MKNEEAQKWKNEGKRKRRCKEMQEWNKEEKKKRCEEEQKVKKRC